LEKAAEPIVRLVLRVRTACDSGDNHGYCRKAQNFPWSKHGGRSQFTAATPGIDYASEPLMPYW
jgi:hypothetical protein